MSFLFIVIQENLCKIYQDWSLSNDTSSVIHTQTKIQIHYPSLIFSLPLIDDFWLILISYGNESKGVLIISLVLKPLMIFLLSIIKNSKHLSSLFVRLFKIIYHIMQMWFNCFQGILYLMHLYLNVPAICFGLKSLGMLKCFLVLK